MENRVTTMDNRIAAMDNHITAMEARSTARFTTLKRIGCQAVIGAFKTVSLMIAESEASPHPLKSRLLKHQLLTWVKWHAKPSHPSLLEN